MLNKKNIMGIIQDHQREIDDLRHELEYEGSSTVRGAIESRLSDLYDDQARYELQAKVWGLIKEDGE